MVLKFRVNCFMAQTNITLIFLFLFFYRFNNCLVLRSISYLNILSLNYKSIINL